jgi:hypothetical protein
MASVVYLLRPRTFARALLVTAIFFAPPLVIGVERGNMDMLLFVLAVAIAVRWARSRTIAGVIWPAVATAAAALLKLYPAFALVGGAWAESGRRRLVWLASGLAVGAYWLANLAEIKLVLSKFPIGGGYSSWGCFIALKSILYSAGAEKHLTRAWAISLAVYAIGFAAAAIAGHFHAKKQRVVRVTRRDWALYWFGAAICCGSFLASNYAYRWVFALLTVPLLLRTAGGPRSLVSLWAKITLVMLVVSFSTPPVPSVPVFFVGQFANWVYILFLVFGCFVFRAQHASAQTHVPEEEEEDIAHEELSEASSPLVAIHIGGPLEPPTLLNCRMLRHWRRSV